MLAPNLRHMRACALTHCAVPPVATAFFSQTSGRTFPAQKKASFEDGVWAVAESEHPGGRALLRLACGYLVGPTRCCACVVCAAASGSKICGEERGRYAAMRGARPRGMRWRMQAPALYPRRVLHTSGVCHGPGRLR